MKHVSRLQSYQLWGKNFPPNAKQTKFQKIPHLPLLIKPEFSFGVLITIFKMNSYIIGKVAFWQDALFPILFLLS